MALAGAPRLILFDEPAAGLSPGERRELVALLPALPAAHGLRADRARPRHRAARRRARHRAAQRPPAKHGTPDEIENDAEVQAIYMGGAALRRPWRSACSDEAGAAGTGPILAIDNLDVHYGRAHALQEVSLPLDRGVLAVVGRNGMGKTTLCNAITGLVPAAGSHPLRRPGDPAACRPT